MKRILSVLLVLALFVPSMTYAEDFMNVTDEEIEKELASVTTEQLEEMFGEFPDNILVAIIDVINMELERRGYDENGNKTDDQPDKDAPISNKNVTVPIGTYIIGEDIPAGTYSITPSSTSLAEIKVFNAKGERLEWHTLWSGEKIGKITLKNGQTIEIGYDSVMFSPYKGLGF